MGAGPRKDGSAAYAVLYRDAAGQQCSQTFDERGAAERFQSLVDSVGAVRALEVPGFEQGASRGKPVPTVAEWARHHLNHLTGVEPCIGAQEHIGGYMRVLLKPGGLAQLPMDRINFRNMKAVSRVRTQNVEADGCGGQVKIQSFATFRIRTENGNDTQTLYGEPKDL